MAEQQAEQFMDAEDGQSMTFQGLTFRDIVLNHMRRITTLASVEWHGGFWEERHKPIGNVAIVEKHYVQSSREIFSNAVTILSCICLPHFDKEMQKAEKECDDLLEAVIERYKQKEKKGDVVEYQQEKLEIKIKLFRALACFLKRKNYFAEEYREDR